MRVCFEKYDKMVNLESLNDSPYQTNKHSKEQIERLAKIMREHGVHQPIHVSKRSNTICFGHGRREAAKLNGWNEFPVVYQDFQSETEEKACVTSDNAIALWADLDLSKINEFMLDEGPDLDVDLWAVKDFEVEPADRFLPDEKEIDENIPTEKECPSCGYKW
jgi:hypothetical protein